MIAGAAMAGLFTGASAVSAPCRHAARARRPATFLHKMSDSDTGKHDCKGKNDCKARAAAKATDNGCKGKNDCKGKGGCNTNKPM